MTRTIAALTIALLIGAAISLTMGACTEQPPADAAMQKAYQGGAEVQTGEWEIIEATDEWGDPTPWRPNTVIQVAQAELTIGGESETVRVVLIFSCSEASEGPIPVGFGLGLLGSRLPNLEADRQRYLGKIDGVIGLLEIIYQNENVHLVGERDSRAISEAKESLEILFAWGEDGQRQSLTWTMDGLHEAFAEACGKELGAEE